MKEEVNVKWLDYIYDAPVLLRHMWSRMFTVGGLMQMFRLRLVMCTVGAVFYLISPLDVIPESVFGLLGIVDDIFVAFLFAIYISVVYRRYIAQGITWDNASKPAAEDRKPTVERL
ncbi:unnamed protein product [Darwinula stevensoni]|uniref:DUF1232 domain-containing protein n=1 Tax=Darwinula stevensoni TaxID=69355 RepID=A0A7R9A4M6_9CRUS|nr:unnamed protein product [Darwinula stevensoni]CAG0890327.1 unnamed protein product [Darwinula stevensoni]